MNLSLYFDLVAQRAASVARIAEMTKLCAQSEGFDRTLWEGMLRQYVEAMPTLDAQIASCAPRGA